MLTTQDFIEMAEKILSLKGKCYEGSRYYGPVSIEGNSKSYYYCRSFRNNYVSIIDFKEIFEDKSGHYNLFIYVNDKRNFLYDTLFLLGLYNGKLVLKVEKEIKDGEEKKQEIKVLERVLLGSALSWL
ncbi:MAG: hypothetical protein N3G19_00105 [Candidatus Pacearchaeota archaeon]|nr:hypothetical protein [Candidatus Pacearchaeota archaeon]